MLLLNERRGGDRLSIADRRRRTRRQRRRRRVSRRTSTLLKTRKSIAVVENRRSDEQRLRTKFSEWRPTRPTRTFVRRLEKHRRRGNFRRGDVTRMKSSTRRERDRRDRLGESLENEGFYFVLKPGGRRISWRNRLIFSSIVRLSNSRRRSRADCFISLNKLRFLRSFDPSPSHFSCCFWSRWVISNAWFRLNKVAKSS